MTTFEEYNLSKLLVALDTNSKAIQQINFIENLGRTNNRVRFSITEEVTKRVWIFYRELLEYHTFILL